MSTKIREQVQAGIDARLAVEPMGDEEFARILHAAYQRMSGADGRTVEEAAREARCAGGPSLEELEERIRARRTAAAVGQVAA